MNANHIFTINLDEDELAEALSDTFDQYVKVDALSEEVRCVLERTDFCDEDSVRDIATDVVSDMEYNILHGDGIEKIVDKRIEAAIHELARSILMAALASLNIPSLVPHLEG